MLGTFRKSSDHVAALERVKAMTRERFALDDDMVILVTEISCDVPGCPPIETVVAFWNSEETRYRYKFFKPVGEVVIDDFPPKWLLPSLVDLGEIGCGCC